jgi:hypothetical protein
LNLTADSIFENQKSVTVKRRDDPPDIYFHQELDISLITEINVSFSNISFYSLSEEAGVLRLVPFLINEAGVLSLTNGELEHGNSQTTYCFVHIKHSAIFQNMSVYNKDRNLIMKKTLIQIDSTAWDVIMRNLNITSLSRDLTGSLNGGGTVIEANLGENGNLEIYNGLFSNVTCGVYDESGNIISGGKGSVINCKLTHTSSKFSINNGSVDYYSTSFTNCRVSTSTESNKEGYGGCIYLFLPCGATSDCFLLGGTFVFSDCHATSGDIFFISTFILNNVYNNFFIILFFFFF